jgi:2Fe-2S ferredoxin
MPKIRFILHDGTEHVVEGQVGSSVMQTAIDNMVPGIIGDCGGNCSCATCHGYVDPDWLSKLTPMDENETVMLDGVMRVEDNSRLTCQITVTEELDGLVVRLPLSQIL